jgi:hypothetical protein
MPLTRSVIVSSPKDKESRLDLIGSVWQDRPFKLQIGNMQTRLNYEELSKLISDADGEIRDYLGEEHA